MKISDRILFFKYALPCAETLIERGTLKREKFKEMFSQIISGREPEENSENVFKVAMANLKFLTIEKKKDIIDNETIREYFLFKHDEVIDERFEEMGDFNPTTCRTYPGIVREIKNNEATVETPLGKKLYRKELIKDLKLQDVVIIHRDFIVEKISKELAIKLWEAKRKYFPSIGRNIFY